MQTQILITAPCQLSSGCGDKITSVSCPSWCGTATEESQGISRESSQDSACCSPLHKQNHHKRFQSPTLMRAHCRKVLSPPAQLKADLKLPFYTNFLLAHYYFKLHVSSQHRNAALARA